MRIPVGTQRWICSRAEVSWLSIPPDIFNEDFNELVMSRSYQNSQVFCSAIPFLAEKSSRTVRSDGLAAYSIS